MFNLLEREEIHCELDGGDTALDPKGPAVFPVTHKVTLGKIVDLLETFKR